MFVIGSNGSSGYNLTRSLRFRASASARLTRTFVTPTNQNKWSLSVWVKLSTIVSNIPTIIGADTSASTALDITTNSTIEFGWSGGQLITTQVFRDPSAWYHILVVADTTNATASNRLKIYVNGAEVTAFGTDNRSALSSGSLKLNSAVPTHIGTNPAAARYYDGYMAEMNFIDGQALTPSSFGSTNALTGVWQPARYTGTYGTNGFYLPFTDNSALTTSSNAGLGKDFSGNGNYFATNNISITSGVTYDSMTDVCTLTSATAANFAVLNPLNNSGTLANANLTWNGTDRAALGTMALPITGKYYFEATCTTVGNYSIIGIADGQAASFNGVLASANFRTYNSGGEKADSTRTASWGSTFTNGDVIGIAVDMDNGALYFAKNNTWQASGVPTSGASRTGAAFTDLISSGKTWVAFVSSTNNNGVWNANHGQRPFTYTPPTNFVALNTFNLPTSTIVKGNTVMDATLYTGTGASLSVTNAASFKPDLVWVKGRSGATDHAWYDSVRGVQKQIESNTTTAETTEATGLTAFGSAGFTVGALAQMNTSAATYVGWQWQAGQGTTSSNTSGSITSTVSVNASAGFSVVTYTGTGAAATVGHGLGVAPSLIIVKRRDVAEIWCVYTSTTGAGNYLALNSTIVSTANTAVWNNTTPTSSVFSVAGSSATNNTGGTYVAYCWTPIAGFSAFGSYTGNGSTDGVFVYTPFRPKFVLIKMTSSIGDWYIFDSVRDPYNATQQGLLPNSSGSETTYTGWGDLLSNGFKIRRTDAAWNSSGGTYIYAAFAENPFKNSLAR